MCAGDQKEHFWDENTSELQTLGFFFWPVTMRLGIILGSFCHKIILQFMIKEFAVKLCILYEPFLAPFTHPKSPPPPRGIELSF